MLRTTGRWWIIPGLGVYCYDRHTQYLSVHCTVDRGDTSIMTQSNHSSSTPTVGIDARYLHSGGSGIARYTMNLLKGLHDISPHIRLIVFIPDDVELPAPLSTSDAFELVPTPGNPRSPADQWHFARRLSQFKIDLLLSLDTFGPLLWPGKRLITIYDIIPIVCRDMLYNSTKSRWWRLWRTFMSVQCKRSAGILTISEYSKTDIHRHLHAPVDKIHLARPGIEPPGPRDQQAIDDVRREFGLAGQYMLYVGRRDPYKNLAMLVRAFADVAGGTSTTVQLVLVGQPDPRYTEAERLVRELGLSGQVVMPGYLTDRQINALYYDAAACVFPSLYEGFGLPVLEAAARGTPVIASNRTAIPEAAGDAAILLDGDDISAWTDAMNKLLTDNHTRMILSENGLRHAREFAPATQARQTLEACTRILACDHT